MNRKNNHDRLVVSEADIEQLQPPSWLASIKSSLRSEYYALLGRPDTQTVLEQLLQAYKSESRSDLLALLQEYNLDVDPHKQFVNVIAEIAQKRSKLYRGVLYENCGYILFNVEGNPIIKPINQPLEIIDILPPEHSEVFRYLAMGAITADQSRKVFTELGGLSHYINQNVSLDVIRSLAKDLKMMQQVERYDSTGPQIDFIEFVRSARIQNPHLTLNNIYALFNFNNFESASKHRGTGEFGTNCFGFSEIFKNHIERQYNLTPAPILYNNNNDLATITTGYADDGTSTFIDWPDARFNTEFTHMSIGVHFTLPTGELMLAQCEMGVGNQVELRVFEFEPRFGQTYYYYDLQNNRSTNYSWSRLVECSPDIHCDPHLTCKTKDIPQFIKRGIRAHLQSVIHKHNEENYGSFSRDAIRFDFYNGLIRITSSEFPKLQKLFVRHEDDSLLSAYTIELEDDEGNRTIVSPYTITQSTLDRSNISRRKDKLWQVKLDLDFLASNPDLPVTIQYNFGVEFRTTARLAVAEFLFEMVNGYDRDSEYVNNLLWIYDNWEEFKQDFFYTLPNDV